MVLTSISFRCSRRGDGDAEGLADGIEVGTNVRRSRAMGLIFIGGDGHGVSSIVGFRGTDCHGVRRTMRHSTFDDIQKGKGRALASEWVNDTRQSTPEKSISR